MQNAPATPVTSLPLEYLLPDASAPEKEPTYRESSTGWTRIRPRHTAHMDRRARAKQRRASRVNNGRN